MNFFRGFSINVICMGLAFALGFANQVLIARGLGEEGRGHLALVATTVMFATLLLGEWLNRGNTFVTSKEGQSSQALSNTSLYGMGLAVILAAAAVAAGSQLRHLMPFLGADWSHYVIVAIILAVVMQRATQAIILGQNRMALYAVLPLVTAVVYLTGTVLALHVWQASLPGILIAWLSGVAVTFAVTFVYSLTGRSDSRGRTGKGLSWDGSLFGRAAAVGGRGAVSAVLIFLLFRSDIYLVKYFMGAEALGVYMIAVVIAEMMQRLPNIAGTVLLPRVIAGPDDSDVLSAAVARNILLFSTAAAAVLLLFGRQIVSIFGPEFAGAFAPLVWMLPGLIASGLGSVLNTRLAGKGYPAITIWAPSIALAVNVVLNILLIPTHGLVGAAVATSAAYIIWAALVTVRYCRLASTSVWSVLKG